MECLQLRKVGEVFCDEDGFAMRIEPRYIPALQGMDGFSHAQILWWFDGCDNEESRNMLTEAKPYVRGPAMLGTFATRSPNRPNPLALSCAQITYIDHENGIVGLAYIDANPGSPVLDIKPYTPSLDRVEQPLVPEWCAHWPKNCESSGDFDWESEFNF